jgi:hypothetical protein
LQFQQELCDDGADAKCCADADAGGWTAAGASADADLGLTLTAAPLCGRLQATSLLSVAARYLQQRADQQAVGAAPAAYQLLYDFWAGRSDWQAAAAAQLALARRLAAEAPSSDKSTLALIASALGESTQRTGCSG